MNQQIRRIIMTISGIGLNGIAVGLFNFSDFGMDPFQVFAHGLWNLTGIGFGTFYMILSLIMLVIVFILDRTKIGLGTLINMFLLGYVAEFSGWILENNIPHPSLFIKIVFLLAGILTISFAAALYFTADLGVSTYDAVALYLAAHTPVPFSCLRITTDIICVVIGFLLHATVGIGTLVTAFFMGPVIAFFRTHAAEPLLYKKSINRT